MDARGLKIRILITIIIIFTQSLSCAMCANAETISIRENWSTENVLNSWETVIDINNDVHSIVTYVKLNQQGDIAIKLRELMIGLKYSVEWDEVYRFIRLRNSENNIKIYVDSDFCDINGERIYLNGAVFIDSDYSYCSLSFLKNILSVETIYIEKSQWNNRINRIALVDLGLLPSSLKPFPDTSLFVDCMPLYINYVDNLKESLPYNTVLLVCDGSNGSDETVIIYTEATLKNFKISSVKYHEMAEYFEEDSIILAPREIAPPFAVALNTIVSEGIPMEAISFTDSEGISYSYLLGYNGKDGSVTANAVILK